MIVHDFVNSAEAIFFPWAVPVRYSTVEGNTDESNIDLREVSDMGLRMKVANSLNLWVRTWESDLFYQPRETVQMAQKISRLMNPNAIRARDR